MRQWRRLEPLLEKVAGLLSAHKIKTTRCINDHHFRFLCVNTLISLTPLPISLTLVSPETSTRTANVVRCVEEQEMLSLLSLCCRPVVMLASDHPPRSRLKRGNEEQCGDQASRTHCSVPSGTVHVPDSEVQ